jgi:hypothetical protein
MSGPHFLSCAFQSYLFSCSQKRFLWHDCVPHVPKKRLLHVRVLFFLLASCFLELYLFLLGSGGRGWGFRAVGACEFFWIMWILHLTRYPFFSF